MRSRSNMKPNSSSRYWAGIFTLGAFCICPGFFYSSAILGAAPDYPHYGLLCMVLVASIMPYLCVSLMLVWLSGLRVKAIPVYSTRSSLMIPLIGFISGVLCILLLLRLFIILEGRWFYPSDEVYSSTGFVEFIHSWMIGFLSGLSAFSLGYIFR